MPLSTSSSPILSIKVLIAVAAVFWSRSSASPFEKFLKIETIIILTRAVLS